MSKLTKPDFTIRWAQSGTTTVPDNTKKANGWIVEKPAYDFMNWIQLRQDTGIAYTFQMGISEWDSGIEYQYSSNTYASYVQRKGKIYKAIQTGTNKDPDTETAYWSLAFDDSGAAATVQTALNTHITNYGTLASLSNAATARTNLSVYSKTETDAAYATIATTYTRTASDARFAPLAGSSGQVFSVGTATVSTHAVPLAQMTAAISAAAITPATTAETITGTSTTKPTTPAGIKGLFNDTGQQSLTTNGYQRLPGGMVMQWGTYDKGSDFTDNEQTTISFPVAFANACLNVQVTTYNVANQTDYELIMSTRSYTTASFVAHAEFAVGGGVGRAFTWFAIGY